MNAEHLYNYLTYPKTDWKSPIKVYIVMKETNDSQECVAAYLTEKSASDFLDNNSGTYEYSYYYEPVMLEF